MQFSFVFTIIDLSFAKKFPGETKLFEFLILTHFGIK